MLLPEGHWHDRQTDIGVSLWSWILRSLRLIILAAKGGGLANKKYQHTTGKQVIDFRMHGLLSLHMKTIFTMVKHLSKVYAYGSMLHWWEQLHTYMHALTHTQAVRCEWWCMRPYKQFYKKNLRKCITWITKCGYNRAKWVKNSTSINRAIPTYIWTIYRFLFQAYIGITMSFHWQCWPIRSS